MGYQQTIIIGNVGRDAELSYTPTGIAVAEFSVAVTKITGKGEARQEKTVWFRVKMWRERAESLYQYIKKGKKVMVTGTIEVRAFKNKDGEPAASLELTANDFEFLDSKSEDSGGGNYSSGGRSSGAGEYAEEAGDIPF